MSSSRSDKPTALGGTRNPLVVHWPKGIKRKGEVRAQYHHAIDIAPTVLEAAGLPEPKSVSGTPPIPIEGVCVLYNFNDAKAKDNRGVYHDGWPTPSTRPLGRQTARAVP